MMLEASELGVTPPTGASLLQFTGGNGDEESEPAQSSNEGLAMVQSPDDWDSLQHFTKTAFRVVVYFLLFGVMFAIPGIVLLMLFASQPDTLTYNGWRLFHPSNGTDWRVCSLEFLGDDYNPVSLQEARVISSPPAPDNFNLSARTCSQFWSGKTADAYIGVVFPRNIDIHSIRIGHPTEVTKCSISVASGCWFGCDSPSSCASCCLRDEADFLPDKVTVQHLGSSDRWIDTNRDQHVDTYSASIDTYAGAPPSNTAKWVDFGVGVGCATIAVILILAAPVQFFEAKQLQKRFCATREELEHGTALILSYGTQQWNAFVENEWGPGGREEKANSLITYCVAFPLLAAFAVVTMYIGSRKKHPDEGLSWALSAEIGIPLAFLLTIGIYPIKRCMVKRKYRHLQDRPQKAILASSTLTFGEVLLFKSDLSKKVLGAAVEDGNGAEGALLCVTYQVKQGKSKVKKLLRIPLPRERAQEVKAFVIKHAAFYSPSPTLMSEVLQTGKVVMKAGKLAHALLS